MTKPKIACLGPSGSFSENTLQATLGHQPLEIIFADDLRNLLLDLENRHSDFIWLPWWNSGCGFLQDSLQKEFLLTLTHSKNNYRIVADNFTPLKFALLGLPGSTLKDVKTIYVNPYTTSLCKNFFREHPHLIQIIKRSSSEAAKEVAAKNDHSIAASANIQSAALYGLDVLKESMLAPEEEAVMQFVLLSYHDIPLPFTLKNNHLITSCAIYNPDKHQLLTKTDLKIQSLRHSHLDPTLHLLDLDGNVEHVTLKKIFGNHLVHYFGCYPRSGKKI